MFIRSRHSNNMESYDNEELWTKFSADCRESFSELFLRFYDRLFRYGMYFSGDKEAVKDGIQKLFFRIWRKRKSLECPKTIDGYLYVSLRRILLKKSDRETARKNRNAVFIDNELNEMLSIEELIISREKRKEREKLFQGALKSLTPRQKEALLLRINDGMSNSEIARIMSLSNKRVRNLIYEATKRLKNRIYKAVN